MKIRTAFTHENQKLFLYLKRCKLKSILMKLILPLFHVVSPKLDHRQLDM